MAHGLKGFSLHCFAPVKGNWIILRLHLAKAAHSKGARMQRKVSKWLGTQDHPHEHTLQSSNFLVLSSGADILKFPYIPKNIKVLGLKQWHMGIWSIFGIQSILGVQEWYIFSIYSLGLLENCFLSIQPIKFWKKHKWSDVSSQCILLEAIWGFLLFLQYQWYLLWWLNCCAFLQVHLLFCKIQVIFWEMLSDQFLHPLMNFFFLIQNLSV